MSLNKTSFQPESANFRYEKKYLIEGMSPADVISILKLHPSIFRELFPMRYVNNIYLDSPLLTDYYSNVNGYSKRQKIRVRWYHDLLRNVKDGVLEFKVKEGEVGTKEQFPFPEFTADASLTEHGFREIIRASSLPARVKHQLRDVEFAVCNRYQRWYFATPDERFRVTVDAKLDFYHLGKFANSFRHHYSEKDNVILELKYAVEDDKIAQRISAALPFRITRSSKYISGVERIYI